ncbi:hypothetical protein ACKWTF_014240 [Chironomus riparius]
MPKSVQTRNKVPMKITTKPDSTVYLLGYDERLSYLFQGNEVKKDDVVKELANYDGTNKITVFHISKTNWHQCTPEELRRIEKGRVFVVQHSGDEFSAHQDENVFEDIYDLESVRNPDTETEPAASDVREDFREVFIFDEFEVPDGSMIKNYYAPDSITSWLISSFSMNEVYGLAIGPPKKLIVKNEFFTKLVLPYSIRFKEKLRVDVMVYNYVENKEALDVTVNMYDHDNKKSFRFFESACSTTASTATTMTKTVSVPHDNAKKVSFYIQSGAERTKFEQEIRIRVDATATSRHGTKYSDKMVKRLKVEPIGVKVYDIQTKNYNLKPSQATKIDSVKKNVTNDDEYPKFIVEIAGDYMTDDMAKVNLGYE